MNALDRVAQNFDSLGLRYQRMDEDRLRIGFRGTNTPYEATLVARGPLLGVIVPRIAVAPERRFAEVLRALNLVNARILGFGAFWLDPSDNGLSFELAMPIINIEISVEATAVIVHSLRAVDAFFPMFAQIIWTNSSADEAFDRAMLELRGSASNEDEDDDMDEAV